MAARLAFARAFASKGPKGVNPFVAWNAFTAETFETTKAELESRGELPTGASPRERRNSVLSALSLKWHAMSDEEKKAGSPRRAAPRRRHPSPPSPPPS